MKIYRWSKAILLVAFGWCSLGTSYGQESNNRIELTAFEVTQEDGSLSFPILLPAVLQQTMHEQGLIPHPFVGNNEDSIQWVSDRNWKLETTFELTKKELNSAVDYRLLLGRVDTFSEIYINDALVGKTDNLFRDYILSVKPQLRIGKNKLVIRLLSTTEEAHKLYLKEGVNYPADNDRNDIHYAPLIRKSQYHFGWDWGPRIITMGLEAPVVLQKITGPTVEDTYIRSVIEWDKDADTPHATSANITVESTIAYALDGTKIRINLLSPDKRSPIGTKVCRVKDGKVSTSFNVVNPLLWMPNGWGLQNMYTIALEMPKTKERKEIPFGIREISLDLSKDSIGQTFAFVVNRRLLYVKGANYLTHDRRFGGGGRTLRQLFEEDIVPAHFNMIRVWGGGDYESEDFYRLADENGILVWQDFPFACSTYPNDTAFRANVSAELKDQLSRIRNHPSIAVFCGNNEILEGLKHWGWKKKYGYSDKVWQKMTDDYDSFFRGLLHDKVKEYAPHVDYIHGSPLSSNWGIPESLRSGDSHYWGVWFGGEDFDTFDKNHGRFASEYGFQSFPEMKTIQSFDPSVATDTMSIYSPLLTKRQRSFIGNERIAEYMQREYPVPTDFADFVYVGQVLHGRGMGKALRAIRRGYPVNQGSLYWQLNDVWPTVSWSGIDYWGNYKAFQYEVQKAYAPVIIDIINQQDGKALCLVTDDIKQSGKLTATAEIYSYGGQCLDEQSFEIQVSKVPMVYHTPLDLKIPDDTFVLLQVRDIDGKLLAENTFYPQKAKEMQLPDAAPQSAIEAKKGELTLTLSSDILVRDVFVETPWQGARYSDNFFDLLPGRAKTITIKHPDITDYNARSEGAVIIHTMNEILKKY